MGPHPLALHGAHAGYDKDSTPGVPRKAGRPTGTQPATQQSKVQLLSTPRPAVTDILAPYT